MNRRDTVTALLALGAVTGPLGVRAQTTPSAQSRTLGILTRAASQDAEHFWLGAFRSELKARGWIEGRNLVIEKAFAENRAERLPALAEGLVRKPVDVIWAFLPEAAIAAARATQAIPIVFVSVAWPVETGLVDSFARPGRNATGVSSYTGIEVSTKRLEFLKAIVPTATRLSWILDARMAETVQGGNFEIRPMLDAAASKLGFEVRYHFVGKSEDIEPVFAEILEWRAQALAVAGSVVTVAARERIAAFALRNRLPSACASRVHVDAGCLLSYSSGGELSELIARGVEYVDRIFRGARPAELPVYRPDKYELLINLNTAKALGLQIPQSVRLRADRVIPAG